MWALNKSLGGSRDMGYALRHEKKRHHLHLLHLLTSVTRAVPFVFQ
jgi:hypothetical protein